MKDRQRALEALDRLEDSAFYTGEKAEYWCVDGDAETIRKVLEEKWLPIETAPNDGTYIILYQPRKENRLSIPKTVQDQRIIAGYCDNHRWFVYQTDPYSYDYEDDEVFPTHWKPLPEPPKEEQTMKDKVDFIIKGVGKRFFEIISNDPELNAISIIRELLTELSYDDSTAPTRVANYAKELAEQLANNKNQQ